VPHRRALVFLPGVWRERARMITPKLSLDEFRRLAADHSVVPVWTELLADLETPVAAYAKLVGDGEGFLLESVEHGERWSRFSFVGRNPSATLIARNGEIEVVGKLAASIPLDQGILAAIEALLDVYRAPSLPDLPPLQSGFVGYLGYDIVREVERLPDVPADDRHLPDAVLSVIGSLAAFDHWRQRVYLIESVPVAGLESAELDTAYAAAVTRIDDAVAALARPLPYAPVAPPDASEDLPHVRSTMGHELYEQAVEVAKEYIRAGDIFQVVLSQRYDLELDADPYDVYRVLRQVNPSPYMYFLRHPEITIVGSSPEPMVQVIGSTVISRPIAGTRRRGRTDEDDRRMAAELKEHPKEIAEHIMLVDLARNDVGRVVRFGTEKVDELLTLERYSHVMHLTSQVSGQLRDGLGLIDVLRATLPAGTVSGAPKVRAMEIIDELEPVKRGPYAGVVGYLDFSGNLDTAIAIRTMFIGPTGAAVQAGAGIVADSDPAQEDLECRNKAAALLAAVPAARRMTAKRRQEGTPA
jgi:anthranilate synthase component 1